MPVFLFTDIEGSTRLWEEHTDDMGAAIARHDAILEEQIRAFGGQITKHPGDGVTTAFDGGQPGGAPSNRRDSLPANPGGPSANCASASACMPVRPSCCTAITSGPR